MYIKLGVQSFRSEFKAYGRGTQFSHAGLGLLFEYLEELEFCEEQYELDVIGLCCDFAEQSPLDIARDYTIELDGLDDDPEAVMVIVRDWLGCEGMLVGETDTTIVYRQF